MQSCIANGSMLTTSQTGSSAQCCLASYAQQQASHAPMCSYVPQVTWSRNSFFSARCWMRCTAEAAAAKRQQV